MNEGPGLTQQLVETYREFLHSIVAATPRVVVGIVLTLLAIAVAKAVQWLLRKVLRRAKFDAAMTRVGVEGTLRRVGVRQALSEILPRVVFYMLLLLFSETAAQAIGLEPISRAIGAFLGYLPNVVSAVLLVLVGSLGGQAAGTAVSRGARESGLDYAGALGNLVAALILFIAGIMALAQLQIQTEIIRVVTLCTLSGIALAFGLSFGLGTRDITRHLIAGFYARKLLQVGQPIEVRGERGTLRAITPTQILIEGKDQTVIVSNGSLLDEIVKQ